MANKDVDSRIVEMQFDGSDFDKGIRKSQKSLEDFKKSLNFDDAAKQMETLSESGSFGDVINGMAKNIKKLATEFTGIGNLSTFIAQKIKHAWQDAFNSVERFAKSLTSDQITEGSKKYDGLLKSVQTIKNATGDSEDYVYQVMEKLNHYTDETSYNFADMANNIGKFTTAGVKLEDAEAEMEGIANWAAFAGQGTAEAQRAMYNISQAMSAGSMRLVDYKSIQNANMDIRKFREEALEAAVAAGTLKKSKDGIYKTVKGGKTVNLDNFTETLQYKWFDKKTMETVFKTFADNTKGIGLEAYKAAQRCTTLNDAINAWKDMLSTGWMKTYENIFGKLSDAMNLFSGLCNKVSESLAKLVEVRNGILERWNVGGGRDSLWGAIFGELETPDGDTLFKGAYGLLDLMQSIGDAIYNAFWDFVGKFISAENQDKFNEDREGFGMTFLATGLTNLTKKFQEFTNTIHDFLYKADPGETTTRFDRLKHVAETIFAVITLVVDVIRGVGQFAGELIKQLYPAIHAVELLIDGLAQMFTGSVAEGVKKNTIGNFFHKLAEFLRPVTTVINVVVQVLAALIGKVVIMLKQSGLINTIGSALKRVSDILLQLITKAINSGAIQKVFDWIQAGISKIPALVKKLQGLASVFLTTAKNSKALKGAKGFFTNIFGGKNIKEILVNLKDNVINLIKKIPELFASIKVDGIFGNIKNLFSTIISSLFGINEASAEGSPEVTEKISEAIAKPIKDLGKGDVIKKAIDKAKPDFLANLKENISGIWDGIANFFSNLSNSEAVKKIKTFFSGTTFMGLLTGVKDLTKWFAILRNGSGLVSIGKGIKSFGKGVKIFGKNLKNLNFTNIFKDMFNISNVINSNNTDNSKRTTNNLSKFGVQLLAIAGAIALIVQAGSHLAKMKPEELKQAGLALAAIIGGLVLAGFTAKKLAGNGASLLMLAASVLILLIPMKILQKMKWGSLMDGILKLCGIVLLLSTGMVIAGNSKPKGFIKLAVALTLLLIPLKILMGMPLIDPSGKGGLIQGIIALAALAFAISGAARLADGKKLKGMISFALALTILMIPVKIIAAMKWQEALQAFGFIFLILATITAMIKITDKAQAGKLAGIVGAIAALTAIGWLIGHTLDWKQVLIGFGPIVLLIGLMGFMLKEASKLSEEQMKGLKSIFSAFSKAIVVIAVSIAVLAALNVDWKLIAAFMGGLVVIVGMVGIMLKLSSKMDAKAIGKVSLVLGLLSLLVVAVGGALVGMCQLGVDWKIIAAFMAGLIGLIAAVGIFMPILSKLDPIGIVLGAAALAAAVVAILGAIALMAPIVLGAIGNAMMTIAEQLKTMSGLLADFFDRMDGIGDGSVQHAMDTFESLKTMVLGFSGFGSNEAHIRSVMAQLNYLGAGLDAFFVNDGKYPDPADSMSFKVLNKFIEIGPSLAAFSIGTLPDQLMYLGVGLLLFHEATKDITEAEPAALGLLQGIFSQADNIEKFTTIPIESFAGQMSALGGAMSLYAKGAEEVTGITVEDGKTPDLSRSITILKAVCDSISGEDGSGEFKIPDNMPDDTKLGLFAGQLESLGTALSTFATAAKGMETDTSKATELLTFLAEIGGYVTKDNLDVVNVFDDAGLAGEGKEGGKLSQFALDIGALGTALATFAQNIGGNEAQFTTGLGVLGRFQELNQKLTTDNLAFASVFNDANLHKSALETFAEDIGALGHSLASFAQNVVMDDGTQADFNYSLRALNFLATLKNRLPDVGGLQELINGHKLKLDELGNEVQGLGQSLSDFSVKITGAAEGGVAFDFEAVINTLNIIQKLVEIVNAMSIINPETGNLFGAGYFVATLHEVMAGIMDSSDYNVSSSESTASMIVRFMEELSQAYAEAGTINTNAIDAFSKIASGINDLLTVDPKANFEYTGQMISAGIADGIKKGESDVIQAAIDVVQAAIDAANLTADTGSPSKVFTQLGEFMDAGLVKGLLGSKDNVEDASTTMTQSAIGGASGIMGAISKAMADSTDLRPTITPVLDLSNVTAAGSTLDSLFSGYTLSLNSVLDKAVASGAKSGPSEVVVQNPTDLTGIQGSIAALQTDIINLQSAISNIKIVLNTGVLAGGLTDDVDANLGMKSLYASRRN